MAVATHICTHCGYEGKPVKPPKDDYEGQSELSKSIARLGNLVIPGLGFMIRPLALFLTLPIHIVLWLLSPWTSPHKHCPNCGLPLMVPLKSDAGWVAKRKQDIKDGLVKIDAPLPHEKPAAVAFGKELSAPGDEAKLKPVEVPKLEKLGTLDEMLADAPPPVREEPKEEAPKPERKIDPETW